MKNTIVRISGLGVKEFPPAVRQVSGSWGGFFPTHRGTLSDVTYILRVCSGILRMNEKMCE